MLRTALKPRWIAALLLALAVSTVFVLLSQWQFSRSSESGAPPPAQTEQVRPLLSVAPAGRELLTTEVDHRVSLTGRYLPGARVFVTGRLSNGDRGYWVVEPFEVQGAPAVSDWKGAAAVIPVARGWVADPATAGSTPSGTVAITGRLLPTEAPASGTTGPSDQVGALATAQLVNRWQRPMWSGFVTADTETRGGTEVGARASGATMRPIVTTAQPTGTSVNWLNIFYAVEWVVFAGFAIYLWWRLVADDHQRRLEADGEDLDEDAYDDGDDPEDPADHDAAHGNHPGDHPDAGAAPATPDGVTGSTRVPSSLAGKNRQDSNSVPLAGNSNEV
ncbi:SURF1 family protein [Tersicoccus sp. MR15.9]|uniref:SURF1 family protein n=1 Tax=Tersicoccus mangrovi TaxID=3121635 RepID=UPI002FE54A75